MAAATTSCDHDIVFQLCDISVAVDNDGVPAPLQAVPFDDGDGRDKTLVHPFHLRSRYPKYSTDNAQTVVRLTGRCMDGTVMVVHVYGWSHYCFVQLPDGDARRVDELCSHIERVNRTSPGSIIAHSKLIVGFHSIFGYRDSDEYYACIYTRHRKHLGAIRGAMDTSHPVRGWPRYEHATYHSAVSSEIAFLLDRCLSGSSWIYIKRDRYRGYGGYYVTWPMYVDNYQYIGDGASQLPLRVINDTSSMIAPFRVLTLSMYRDKDRLALALVGGSVNSSTPTATTVFTTMDMDNRPHNVHYHHNITDAVRDFVRFVKEYDPDFLIVYDWSLLSKQLRSVFSCAHISMNLIGRHGLVEGVIPGRIVIDTLLWAMHDLSLRSYGIHAISMTVMSQPVEYLSDDVIARQSPSRVISYVTKRCRVLYDLNQRVSSVINLIQISAVTGPPIQDIHTRGQAVRVQTQIIRESSDMNYLVPDPGDEILRSGASYVGGLVLEPSIGLHDGPVYVLDFKSLYPSIMIAYNMCYSTVIMSGNGPVDTFRTPAGVRFAQTKQGVIPAVLIKLLDARAFVKNLMKTCTDPSRLTVLKARQYALKIAANSVYGFTGAVAGPLPCLQVASAVTSQGRELLQYTQQYIENEQLGHVLYGDTDSVMMTNCTMRGDELVTVMNKLYKRPIQLVLETVMSRMLLIRKRGYAGLTDDHVVSKGLVNVRRDVCEYPSMICDNVINMLLKSVPRSDIERYVTDAVRLMLEGRIGPYYLVLSRGLHKNDDEYEAHSAHLSIARRKRDLEDVGDDDLLSTRVRYLITAGTGPVYKRAHSPDEVLVDRMNLDNEYYARSQLSLSLIQILGPLWGDAETKSLLNNVKPLHVDARIGGTGGIVQYFGKKNRCLQCHVTMTSDEPLCESCASKSVSQYQYECTSSVDIMDAMRLCCNECLQCQDNHHNDILCTNDECPVYFKRMQLLSDIEDVFERLNRFS